MFWKLESKPTETSMDSISQNYHQMHNKHSKQRSLASPFGSVGIRNITSASRKRDGTVSINRALNCTKEMACNHLNELTEELIKANIFINAIQLETGVWQGDIDTIRVCNHDETPQFVNYGVDGTPNGLVYAGRGESCQRMIRENRECITVHLFVSFGGDIAVCHITFKGKGISAHMAPKEAVEGIANLLISTNASGSQNHSTLLNAYQMFDLYLDENNIK